MAAMCCSTGVSHYGFHPEVDRRDENGIAQMRYIDDIRSIDDDKYKPSSIESQHFDLPWQRGEKCSGAETVCLNAPVH